MKLNIFIKKKEKNIKKKILNIIIKFLIDLDSEYLNSLKYEL